jgi:hypothetical protein
MSHKKAQKAQKGTKRNFCKAIIDFVLFVPFCGYF